MTRWVALMRGVNVGGANRLAMADLRATLGSLGLENAATYIQSGNAVFDTSGPNGLGEQALAGRISDAIAARHQLSVPVVLRTATEFRRSAVAHPDIDSGLDPKLLHVVFLDAAPVDGGAIDPERYGPDRFTIVGREVYVTYPGGSARSKLTCDLFGRVFGATATARNLNTVRKLDTMSSPS